MIKSIIKSKDLEEFYTDEKCFITEVLNTETFNNFSVAKARVAVGVTTTIHKLNDTDEVYFILSGQGKVEINEKEIGILEENDLVFIPRNSYQRITNISEDDLIFLCICAPRFEVKNYE